MRRARALLVITGSLSSTAASPAVDPAVALLGTLPAGSVSGFQASGNLVEVCRNTIFPPEAIAPRLPAGYRLARLSERTSVPAVAELLSERPELSDHAKATFCVLESDRHDVAGRPLFARKRGRFAFLWADIAPTGPDTGPIGPMASRPRRAQIFVFYDTAGLDHALARRANPGAIFGRIAMRRTGEQWDVSLRAGDGVISGSVRMTTPRVALRYATPAFETLLLSDEASSHYNILTFAGHQERRAHGRWTTSGRARWTRAFTDNGDAPSDSFVQDGLAARFGLYPFEGAGRVSTKP